ncbi:MAG: PAS domain S-box protein [Chitinivibrionales bacterium]|nr:PAS domain S-box protein [Chitinivibrionales bacterium]
MSKGTVLFLCMHNSTLSQMAEGFARRYAPQGVSCLSAGLQPQPVRPLTFEIMDEMECPISGAATKSIAALGERRFDVVVTLGEDAREQCPVLSGAPAFVNWPLELPELIDSNGNEAARIHGFRKSAQKIRESVASLFRHGFLAAFVQQKDNVENILNSLSEGIIAHDLNRRIFFFNKGAEKLTGLPEAQVLGKDCHESFLPKLCGEECSFCGRKDFDGLTTQQYTTVYHTPDGTRKEFDVTVMPMQDDRGQPVGIVASLSDQTQVKTLERQLGETRQFYGLIGQDYKMQLIYDLIRDLSQCDFPVVITGESGTGKELVARAVHNESSRKDKLFVPINCGALPEGTLESELFGHVKGSFTGAFRDKKGRFELADGGTIFLDEVAELSQAMQVKLLRVLQEGTFEPVGSETTREVEVRVISATNRNLKEQVKKGAFREDLYYRLAVVPIDMPPLRERRNDIPILTEHFLKTFAAKLNGKEFDLSEEALSMLMSYSWPGNVRQLQNAIQFSLIKCRDTKILPEHLPPEMTGGMLSAIMPSQPPSEPGKVGRKNKLTVDTVEIALKKCAGNKAKAARMLGVGRATLYNMLRNHPHLTSVGEVE